MLQICQWSSHKSEVYKSMLQQRLTAWAEFFSGLHLENQLDSTYIVNTKVDNISFSYVTIYLKFNIII